MPDRDRSPEILLVAIFFTVTTWLSVMLRLYVRKFMIKSIGSDDITMVLTLLGFTAYISCQFGGLAHGTGKRRDAITDEDAEIALRYWWFCELFYTITTTLLKITLGLFLLRITIERFHIWIIRSVMVLSGAFGIAYCFIVIFQCQPVSFWWNLDPNAKGKCVSRSLFADAGWIVSVLNSIADWTFGILPIFIVKDLRMKTSIKIIVAIILGFGAIGSAATIIRMPYIHTIVGYKGEFLWRSSDVAIWTTVEVGIGITAGCIATLKPLLKSFKRLIGGKTSTLDTTVNSGYGKSTPPSFHMRPLDTFVQAKESSQTITTITSRRRMSLKSGGGFTSWIGKNGSQEFVLSKDMETRVNVEAASAEPSIWGGGIVQSVEFTTSEERDEGGITRTPSNPTSQNKPVVVYEGL